MFDRCHSCGCVTGRSESNGSVDTSTNVWVCIWMKKVCGIWTIISTKRFIAFDPESHSDGMMEFVFFRGWISSKLTWQKQIVFFFRYKCHVLVTKSLVRTRSFHAQLEVWVIFEPIIAPPSSEKLQPQAKASKGGQPHGSKERLGTFDFCDSCGLKFQIFLPFFEAQSHEHVARKLRK